MTKGKELTMKPMSKLKLLIVGALVLGLVAIPAVPAFTFWGFKALVERTGQTQCWNETDNLPDDCSGTGQDGELQAGVRWPALRFIDLRNGTVYDRLTTLIWLKDANCFSVKDWPGALTTIEWLNEGTDSACAEYTAGQIDDWRLPNVKELQSLIDFGKVGPALPSGHPFEKVETRYWSSTTLVSEVSEEAAFAWQIDLDSGDIAPGKKTGIGSQKFVWPVRGGL